MVKETSKKKISAGSTVQQVENFTNRINSINEHLATMKKDHSGRRGLLILVSKRRRLLNYLKKSNPKDYLAIIKKLNLRK